jgi:hypothetical protein
LIVSKNYTILEEDMSYQPWVRTEKSSLLKLDTLFCTIHLKDFGVSSRWYVMIIKIEDSLGLGSQFFFVILNLVNPRFLFVIILVVLRKESIEICNKTSFCRKELTLMGNLTTPTKSSHYFKYPRHLILVWTHEKPFSQVPL